MENIARTIKSMQEKIQHSYFGETVKASFYNEIERLELSLLELQKDLLSKSMEIKKLENLINELPEPHSTILFDKYFKGDSIRIIARKLNYSEPRIYQLQKEALNFLRHAKHKN